MLRLSTVLNGVSRSLNGHTLKTLSGGLVRAPFKNGAPSSQRPKTTETGNDKSGHINAGQYEGILFLDSKS